MLKNLSSRRTSLNSGFYKHFKLGNSERTAFIFAHSPFCLHVIKVIFSPWSLNKQVVRVLPKSERTFSWETQAIKVFLRFCLLVCGACALQLCENKSMEAFCSSRLVAKAPLFVAVCHSLKHCLMRSNAFWSRWRHGTERQGVEVDLFC